MADLRQRTLVSVRATTESSSTSTKVFARKHCAELGASFSFDNAEPSMTGAETLLGLLANDVLDQFATVSRKRRLVVDRLEATVSAELCDSLRLLGVIGASGTPRYDSFNIRVYIDSGDDSKELKNAWDEAILRAPLLNTLKQSSEVHIDMQVAD